MNSFIFKSLFYILIFQSCFATPVKQNESALPVEDYGLLAIEVYNSMSKKSGQQQTPGKEKTAFTSYIQKLKHSQQQFEMIAIPAGDFFMGSPESEKGRQKDESPRHKVKVDAFWMAKTETTWQLYELWAMSMEKEVRKYKKIPSGKTEHLIDAIASPTAPYTDMTFGMGKDDYPAICMTQLAAKVFCMWLSAKTGHFYRLPTEAEWEYACRAGSLTRWHFGDEKKDLEKYAWFEKNSNFQYQKVGTKAPNPWGLFDMHGNVSEWVLDQYDPAGYSAQKSDLPLTPPTKLYPRCVRGGSWDDSAEKCRSAARRGSHPDWKQKDPQIPKSVWYHTDAQFVGFRMVRPLKMPEPELLRYYWPTDEEMKTIQLK